MPRLLPLLTRAFSLRAFRSGTRGNTGTLHFRGRYLRAFRSGHPWKHGRRAFHPPRQSWSPLCTLNCMLNTYDTTVPISASFFSLFISPSVPTRTSSISPSPSCPFSMSTNPPGPGTPTCRSASRRSAKAHQRIGKGTDSPRDELLPGRRERGSHVQTQLRTVAPINQ
jgi:hypothetical protein